MPRVLADLWLFGKYVGDPTVTAAVGRRVANGRAPSGWASPWGVFQMASEVSNGPIGQPAASHTLRYQAEFVAEGESTAPIEAAAQALTDAIDGASEELPGGVAIVCRRLGGVPRPFSYDGDRVFAHLGSEYEILVLGGG